MNPRGARWGICWQYSNFWLLYHKSLSVIQADTNWIYAPFKFASILEILHSRCFCLPLLVQMTLLSLIPSQVLLLRKGLPCQPYQTQPVPHPKSSPNWLFTTIDPETSLLSLAPSQVHLLRERHFLMPPLKLSQCCIQKLPSSCFCHWPLVVTSVVGFRVGLVFFIFLYPRVWSSSC